MTRMLVVLAAVSGAASLAVLQFVTSALLGGHRVWAGDWSGAPIEATLGIGGALLGGVAVALGAAAARLRLLLAAALLHAVGAIAVGAVLAVLLLLGWLVSGTTVWTVIDGAGGRTDLVAVERSFLMAGSGEVYLREGPLLTRVGELYTDDGYRPIAAGDFSVRDDGGTLLLRYSTGVGPALSGSLRIELPGA